MKRLSRHILRLFVTAVLLLPGSLAAAAPVWEKVAPVSTEVADAITDSYEVRLSDNAIILTLPDKTSVKVFTILGQLVAEKQLEAGTWRLPLSARGIYILKVGTSTRRITI